MVDGPMFCGQPLKLQRRVLVADQSTAIEDVIYIKLADLGLNDTMACPPQNCTHNTGYPSAHQTGCNPEHNSRLQRY